MSSRYKTGDIVRITSELSSTPGCTSGVWVVVHAANQALPWAKRLDMLADENYIRLIAENEAGPL